MIHQQLTPSYNQILLTLVILLSFKVEENMILPVVTLHFGTIVCSLGTSYKGYCSNIARTLLIDPSTEQEQTYKLAYEVQQMLMKSMKPGVPLNSLMNKATKLIKEKNPALLPKFSKTCGFGIGLEFHESAYSINAKNSRTLKEGMVFNLSVCFLNVEQESTDPKCKRYTVLIADTVVVNAVGEPEVLTYKSSTQYSEISHEKPKTSSKAKEKSKKQPKPEAPNKPAVKRRIQFGEKHRESRIEEKNTKKSRKLLAQWKRSLKKKENYIKYN